jgi:MFS superfamily sulfate permease-like transporter
VVAVAVVVVAVMVAAVVAAVVVAVVAVVVAARRPRAPVKAQPSRRHRTPPAPR